MMSEKRRESFGSSITQKFKAPENKNITDRPGKTQVIQPRMESEPDSKLHLYK